MTQATDHQHIESVMKQIQERILSLPGINGLHIGRKTVAGVKTDDIAIVVHVDKKIPVAQLEPAHIIEPIVDGVKTDIIENGRASHLVVKEANASGAEKPATNDGDAPPLLDPRWFRPAVGGCQIATTSALGTLGGFVRSNGDVHLLSCRHVIGDAGAQVYQPQIAPQYQIATVIASDSTLDCAIAEIASSVDWTNYILEFGPIQDSFVLSGAEAATGTYQVHKRGAASGSTYGEVTGYAYSGYLQDGTLVTNLFLVNPISTYSIFATSGDSGSFVVNDQYEVIGILNGGFKDGTTLVVPISPILTSMNAQIVVDNNPPLYLVHRSGDNDEACYECTLVGDTFGADTRQDIGTCWPPTLCMFRDQIYNMRQEPNQYWGGGKLMSCILKQGAWGQDTWLGAGTWMAPSCAVYQGKLYCIHHDANYQSENVFLMTYDGTTWSADTQLPFGSCLAPTLVVWNGLLHCFHAGGSDYTLYHTTFDGTNWSQDTQLAPTNDPTNYYKSSFTPSVVAYKGLLYCFLIGSNWYTDNLHFFTYDGSTWSAATDTGANTTLGPSAIVQNGVLHIFHEGNDGNSQLFHLTFDGTNWSTDTGLSIGTLGAPGLAFLPTFQTSDSDLIASAQANNRKPTSQDVRTWQGRAIKK